MAASLTSLSAMTRSRESWPRHKAKARARHKARKAVAAKAQRERDEASTRGTA